MPQQKFLDQKGVSTLWSLIENKMIQTDFEETDENSPAFLQNKPFGKTKKEIKWDGEPTDNSIELNNSTWYQISDTVPDIDTMQNVYVSLTNIDEQTLKFESSPKLDNGILQFNVNIPELGETYALIAAYENNSKNIPVGIYCIDPAIVNATLGTTIINLSLEWTETKKIDYNYLPKALQFGMTKQSVSWDGVPTSAPVMRNDFTYGQLPWYHISNTIPNLTSKIDNIIETIHVGENDKVQFEVNPALEKGLLYFYINAPGVGRMAGVLVAYDGNSEELPTGMYCVDFSIINQVLGVMPTLAIITWDEVIQIDEQYLLNSMAKQNPFGLGGFQLNRNGETKTHNAIVIYNTNFGDYTPDFEKNIYNLDWNGNAEYKGTVTAQEPTQKNHLTTKDYVDNAINNIEAGQTNSIEKAEINELTGELYIYYTNGQSDNVGKVVGEPGNDIAEVDVDEEGNLWITYSNSPERLYIGNIKGPQGEMGPQGETGPEGNSIFYSYIDAYGQLRIRYSNDSEDEVGKVVPEKGVDYFTDEDISDIVQRVLEEIPKAEWSFF